MFLHSTRINDQVYESTKACDVVFACSVVVDARSKCFSVSPKLQEILLLLTHPKVQRAAENFLTSRPSTCSNTPLPTPISLSEGCWFILIYCIHTSATINLTTLTLHVRSTGPGILAAWKTFNFPRSRNPGPCQLHSFTTAGECHTQSLLPRSPT